jgi:RimJ/RimL family protein N-acetyltransferase
VSDDQPAGGGSGAWPAAQPLRTDRLDLEPLRVGHAGEMVGVLADPALYAWTGGAPPTAGQLRERYARQAPGRSPDGRQGWLNWVLRLRDTGAAAGTVQATLAREDGATVAELAWVVGTAAQRRGYAREAASAVAAWLRGLGVDRLVAHVHPEHAASAAVARHLGMRATGVVVDGETRWST